MSTSSDMNTLMRYGGRGASTGTMPGDDSGAKGSRDFTVVAPDTHAPTDQFIYEPLDTTPGAWAVYPPGVPCDPGSARIARATPAGVNDFAKMQSALDEESSPAEGTPADSDAAVESEEEYGS